ncbi:GTP pyrophosphokinase (p)ppGpp synthetase I [Vibrio maritimus]|uniref:GTP pyrophosphokinase (P)ppGpp synthetase I n=1 Tax=Vibrio maritimus TaxID=990268 RepID=A0A090RVW1_9VIBR|nr:GTP pyrophosphokinase (p)ppGpp synthetase I [Vibrio maritimus]
MVAVRSAHLNPEEQFNLDNWIASLKQDKNTSKRLKDVYRQCEEIVADSEQGALLLWRGREMNEILITLSMDKATLVAAQLYPVVSSGLYDRELLEENYGKEIIKLIDGVEEMAAIGQLNVTLEDSEASGQVDNVRRMLLAMVDDFRCVVIKLAERICNLREVKDEPMRYAARQRKSVPTSTHHSPIVWVSVSSNGKSKTTPSATSSQTPTNKLPSSFLSVVSSVSNTSKTLLMT